MAVVNTAELTLTLQSEITISLFLECSGNRNFMQRENGD